MVPPPCAVTPERTQGPCLGTSAVPVLSVGRVSHPARQLGGVEQHVGMCDTRSTGGHITGVQAGACLTSQLCTARPAAARPPTGTHLRPLVTAMVPSKGTPRAGWKDAACLHVLRNGRSPTQAFPWQKCLGLCYALLNSCFLQLQPCPATGCWSFPRGQGERGRTG